MRMKKNIVFLFLICLQLSFCALSAITKKEAQSLVDNRRYAEAVVALKSLMSQSAYAKDADCNKWLGKSLSELGRYSEALPYLEYAVKQNRRSGAQWYLAIVQQHLYNFDEALEAVEAYRPVLSSDFWLSRADSLETEIRQGMRAMDHVEDVVVIDSLLVPRETFFSYYRLGAESGRVLKGSDGLFFENQAGDYRIFAINDELFQSHQIQGEWEEKDLLPGLGSEDFQVIDPFLRSDGETLYFASDSIPGLGGLDIYKTKYNADEGVFYQPERLGMPFNSPFDDYMFAIDETHQIGWWATERKQHADSVVIYLFQLDDDPEYLDEPTVSRARIDNIAETWRQEGGYADLVASIMNAEQQVVIQEQIRIVIGDNRVYTKEEQFRSQQALAAYRQSVGLQKQRDDIVAQLSSLRQEYVQAGNGGRMRLKPQILSLEEQLLQLEEQVRTQIKLYRSLEQ